MFIKIGDARFVLHDCVSFYDRFRGLMFTRNIDYCLRFKNCNSIHTFFMLEPIDVVMTDIDNNVLFIFNNVRPWRVILPKKGVYNTYEFPGGSVHNIKKIVIE